jgi:hypothetical protein
MDYCYPSRKANSGKILLARSNFWKRIGSNSASNYVKNSENNLVVVVVAAVVIVNFTVVTAAAAFIIIIVLLFAVSTVLRQFSFHFQKHIEMKWNPYPLHRHVTRHYC